MAHENTPKIYNVDSELNVVEETIEQLEVNLADACRADKVYADRGIGHFDGRKVRNAKVAAYVKSNLPEVIALSVTDAEANGKSINIESPEEYLAPPSEEDMNELKVLLGKNKSLEDSPVKDKLAADWQSQYKENSVAIKDLGEKIKQYSGVDVLGIAGIKVPESVKFS